MISGGDIDWLTRQCFFPHTGLHACVMSDFTMQSKQFFTSQVSHLLGFSVVLFLFESLAPQLTRFGIF